MAEVMKNFIESQDKRIGSLIDKIGNRDDSDMRGQIYSIIESPTFDLYTIEQRIKAKKSFCFSFDRALVPVLINELVFSVALMQGLLDAPSAGMMKKRKVFEKARGLKKHLKRLNAPKHWMLDKLGGAFAPKPSSGPHKSRECLPLVIIMRNRLKYALTYREVISILMQRQVMVDGKVRTDKTYPAGFMDVVSIPKTNENFRLLYDTKGRFRLHSLRDEESKFKLCKVRSVQFGQKGIPYLNTYDGRTIRYPDPLIKANDTIKLDLESNKIVDFIKFDVGNVVMVTGGRNRGRVGVIKNREKHKGSFETLHIQDSQGHEFATRLGNVFTLGKGTKPWVSLPKGKGIKLTIIEEARKRLAAQSATPA
ncbi:hypothetical protein MTR67_025414 [Solanum verrucosum]|uniref:KOW domain-containing protein n=1 Tax=Solanum verrucosum TaxID=315347 RepID=A0AAF0R5S3_SOLVR|nr:hypothetical protein MTR67_025414 [Solanum verrucosum]